MLRRRISEQCVKKKTPQYNHVFFAWNDFVYGDKFFIIMFLSLATSGYLCMPRYHSWISKDRPGYVGKVIETNAPISVLKQLKRAIEIKHDFGDATFIISEDPNNIIEDVISEKYKKKEISDG